MRRPRDPRPRGTTPRSRRWHYAADIGTNSDGADYLPRNDGKFLVADDGTTILQGRNAEGQFGCCAWDVTFDTTSTVEGFAVYRCAP